MFSCQTRARWRARARQPQWRHPLVVSVLVSVVVGSLAACAATGTSVAPPSTPTIVARASDPQNVEPRGENFAVAKCLSGEQMVGGGYLLTPSAFPIAPYFSYPATATIWSADVQNTTDAPMTVTAYATCLKSAADVGMVIVKGDAKTIFGGAADESLAVCPIGAVITGGGYTISGGPMTLYIDGSGPGDGQWVVDAHATTPAATFQAYALCATQHLSASARHAELNLKLPGDIAAAVATCPDTTSLLTGGGFARLTGESLIVGSSRPVLTTTAGSAAPALPAWEVAARNSSAAGSAALRLFDDAICAQVSADLHPGTTPTTTAPTSTATSPPPTATTGPAPAKLSVTPTTADAFCLNGQYPSISVKNIGGQTLTWSAQASDQAVTLTPDHGSLAPGASATVQASGSHPGPSLSISFTGNGGNATVTFTCK